MICLVHTIANLRAVQSPQTHLRVCPLSAYEGSTGFNTFPAKGDGSFYVYLAPSCST